MVTSASWTRPDQVASILREMSDADKEAFGARIANARERQGLSQEELADRIHVSSRAVIRWEKGENVPHGENLRELAQALHLEIPDLVIGPDNPNNPNIRQRLDRIETMLELLLQERGITPADQLPPPPPELADLVDDTTIRRRRRKPAN